MEKDVKQNCIDLLSNQSEIKRIICLTDDGKQTNVFISGTGIDLAHLLARAMMRKSDFLSIVKKAVQITELTVYLN